ncbi:MMPL family transporter [Streptomyces sp. NPDC004065]|uniref:MMPL family transporter n=1 Tax=Streptomyces sp. NPDC004065 TaxID=3364689 RepID=UPI00385094BB
MYRWLGDLATRRPVPVLAAALAFLVLCVLLGSGASGRLKTQGYNDPASDSTFAARTTAEYRGTAPNLVVVARTDRGDVDDPAARAAGRELTRRLTAQPHVRDVSSYWNGGAAELRGRDGRAALLLAHVDGTAAETGSRAERVRAALTGPAPDGPAPDRPAVRRAAGGGEGPGEASPVRPGAGHPVRPAEDRAAGPERGASVLAVHVGGTALAEAETQSVTASDLKRAETLVLPCTLILLILVFGSVVAAALPLLIGVLAIGGTLLVLDLLGSVTDVSVFALNLTTALGLGLGIDYGLLVVSRFREELAAGRPPREAARRTVGTAGHTIFFSAATVCAALATLLVFPPYFLRSFAYAGIAVVAVAALAATTVLPALLTLLGRRVNAWAVPWRRGARAGSASRFWAGLARVVVRRPLMAALPVLGLLAVLALPFAHAGFATPDDRTLPPTASSRQAGDLVREEFDARNAGALTVFTTSTRPGAARNYAPGLSALPGVAEVVGPTGVWRDGHRVAAPGGAAPGGAAGGPVPAAAGGPALWTVVPSVDPQSRAAQSLVHAIRRTPTPADTAIHVGGPSAVLVDAKDTIARRLPLALSLMAVSTFLLLFRFSRSVVLPLKAIALNGLGLAAVLGSLVWVFQSGHLRSLLGFTPGPLSTTMPILLFCIVFGLSVDYEVFVLARIKEAHEAGQGTADSIVTGLARTGGIVSTAGALLALTLLSFGSSRVALLQFFGIGAGFGVLLDATLVRGVLVPALMRLAGGLNWWAPRPFRAGAPGAHAKPSQRRVPPPPPPSPPPPRAPSPQRKRVRP